MYDQIEGAGHGPVKTALAVGRVLDCVPLARQPIGQRQDETRLVLDEQQASHVSGGADDAALVPTSVVFV